VLRTWDVIDLLNEIADTGRDPVRGGYSRHLFDPADLALRAWFARRAADLGLDVVPDGNGNLWAYWGAPGPDTVGTGSHLDSVPGGGALDGPLGVASALAAVARLRASGFAPARPVAVIAFAEEEGSRFGIACLGSKLLAGVLDATAAAALTDPAGVSFAAAAADAGLDPARTGRDEALLRSLGTFVELHVEQGRALADIGAPVAVASSILAHGRWKLTFAGEGNHAGATPMAGRRDPVVAASAAVLAARSAAAAHDNPVGGVNARATVGRLVPVPGGTNVIASRVDAWLDVRGDTDAATRAARRDHRRGPFRRGGQRVRGRDHRGVLRAAGRVRRCAAVAAARRARRGSRAGHRRGPRRGHPRRGTAHRDALRAQPHRRLALAVRDRQRRGLPGRRRRPGGRAARPGRVTAGTVGQAAALTSGGI
jgi:N-carbamoyl-L-amino-acid hydrolase